MSLIGGFINGINQNRGVHNHGSVEDLIRSTLGNRFIDQKIEQKKINSEQSVDSIESSLHSISEVLIASSEITSKNDSITKKEDYSDKLNTDNFKNPGEIKQIDKENVISGFAKNSEDTLKNRRTETPESTLGSEVSKIKPINKKSEYDFSRDVNETFECIVSIEGTDPEKCKSRLILKTDTWNLFFDGIVKRDGTCSVPLKKLSIFPEGTLGYAYLEIIVDDVLFIPWESNFRIIGLNKKVFIKPPVIKSTT